MAAKGSSRSSLGHVVQRVINPKKRRPGVHAKRGTSRTKTSKNYRKPYRGQGKRR